MSIKHKVRLLFQPAEEGPGGAKPMIEEGCLQGIDEVYGFHNVPNFDEGDIRVCHGPIFACSTTLTIKIIGKEGHLSDWTTMNKNCLEAGMSLINIFHEIKAKELDTR